MTEALGLVASIVQIAGTGAKLSSALYHFTTSAARADQDITDIASDIELTSNALESVGKIFETEDTRSMVSKKAIMDANNLIKRCEAVFKDITELLEKRRTISDQGDMNLSMMGKLAWPMKEQRVELYSRRLESLKNSLTLLLHVLQLAQGQARGQLETKTVEQEREKIRELHQQQQDSLKCLQALEARLNKSGIDDETPSSRPEVSTHESTAPHVHVLLAQVPDAGRGSDDPRSNDRDISHATVNDVDTSDSDDSATDDEEDLLSREELAKAEQHVRKLLRRITQLQKSSSLPNNKIWCKKRRMNKTYQQFCQKWETDLAIAPRPQKPRGTGRTSYVNIRDEQQHWLEYVIPSWISGYPKEEPRQRQLWSNEGYYSNFVQNMYPSATRSTPEPAVSEDDEVNQQMALLLMQPNQRLSPSANNTTFQIDLPEDTEQQERTARSQELVGTPGPAHFASNRRADSMPDSLSKIEAWERWQDRGRPSNRPGSINQRKNDLRGLSREERRREIELGHEDGDFGTLRWEGNAKIGDRRRDRTSSRTLGSEMENCSKSTSPQDRPGSSSWAPKRERSCSIPSAMSDDLDFKETSGEIEHFPRPSVDRVDEDFCKDIVDVLLEEWTIRES